MVGRVAVACFREYYLYGQSGAGTWKKHAAGMPDGGCAVGGLVRLTLVSPSETNLGGDNLKVPQSTTVLPRQCDKPSMTFVLG